MLALTITDLKNFMNCFLKSETFDHFLVSEAVITTNVTYQIDGALSNGFYSSEDLDEMGIAEYSHAPFSLLRPVFFELIKGKHTPVSFRFVLMLSPKNLEKVLAASDSGFSTSDVGGMFVNFKFQNGSLSCTTGISYQTFSLDHLLDQEWDQMIKKFLTRHEISFDEIS